VDTIKERGIGACLLQQDFQGQWRPVSFFLVRLRGKENERSATELEAQGLVYSIRHWSSYLLRIQRLTAVVDHSALVWLVERLAKTANGRILHWISDLMEYNFVIIHKAGSKHVDADAISRLLLRQEVPSQRPDYTDLETTHKGPITDIDIQDLNDQIKYMGDFISLLHDILKSERSTIKAHNTPELRMISISFSMQP
jgi:hypothetical protein